MWHYEMGCLVVLLDSQVGWIAVSIDLFFAESGNNGISVAGC